MSDNTVLNLGTGGDTIATDDIAGVKYQRVKIGVGADGVAVDVSTAAPMPVWDAGGSLTIDGTVLVAGTTSIAGVVTVSGVVSTSGASAGDVAHDGVDTGNPVKVGHKAIAVGASPTAVAAGDRSDSYANRHGIPFVQPGHPNVITVRANYTSTQTNAAIITQATGGKLVITRCSVALDNANSDTVAPAVRIGLAAATTPTTTGVVLSHPGLPPGFIHNEGNGSGILGIGADDEDLRITTGTLTTGSLDVLTSYYVLPS